MMTKSAPKTKATATEEECAEESSSDDNSVVSGKGATEIDTADKKPKLMMDPTIPNVIYIGHLPRDCEERALTEFLKQFGRLVQLRVCRSHKTGGSKGYAFAKFADPEVAAIAADTVNGHMLFQKRLVSHVLAPEQNHPKLFSSNAPKSFQKKTRQTGPRSLDKMQALTNRLKKTERKKRTALEASGIDYDFPGYGATGVTTEQKEDEIGGSSSPKNEGKAKTEKKKRKKSIDDAATEEESSPSKINKTDKTKPQSKLAKKSKDKTRRKSA